MAKGNRLKISSLRHKRRNRTAQQPILVRACDAEVPAQSTRALSARWHALPHPRPYIFLRPLSPTSLRHRRRNRTALYRLRLCSSSGAASEKGGGGLLWLAVKTSARQRQCSRLRSVSATQRHVFLRFDEVLRLRHTVLCRPRRVSAGECGTRAPRAHAYITKCSITKFVVIVIVTAILRALLKDTSSALG